MAATITKEAYNYIQSTICAPPQPRQEGPARGSLNRATYDLLHKVVDRKDNTWLQLDVCPSWRETRRCEEGDLCCHAHPPQNIEILESNRVVACYDDVKKGACKRQDCKFFHPPNHLKNVVNTNGRNNLRLRNELKQQFKTFSGTSDCAGPQPYPTQATPQYTPYYYPVPYNPDMIQNHPYLQYSKENPIFFQLPESYPQPNPSRIYQRPESPLAPPGDSSGYPQQDLRKRSLSPEKVPHSKFHPYMTNSPERKQTFSHDQSKPQRRSLPEFLPAMPLVPQALPNHHPELLMYSPYQNPHPLAQFSPYFMPQLHPQMLYMNPSLPVQTPGATNGETYTIPTITTCRSTMRNQE
eukprot:GFUD01007717.1.p1 GENE.GFUD01007717.1~~GFUD01007717.1.p1  ORF type:complete len:353 (-),score=68.14 GFUD01007717.1:275-1333(-)